jgi:hypothetical protein
MAIAIALYLPQLSSKLAAPKDLQTKAPDNIALIVRTDFLKVDIILSNSK